MKKIFFTSIVVILILCCTSCVRNPEVDPYQDMYISPYRMDEHYSYVDNIPYEKYLTEALPYEGEIFRITDYGASTSATGTINQAAINAAIDAANAEGGGLVLISGGVYKTGTIVMKSDVTLRVDQDSTLLSLNYDENIASGYALSNGVIYANGVSNITIEGPGIIAGAGESFTNEAEAPTAFYPMETFELKSYVINMRSRIRMERKNSGRVNLLHFNNCENLTIRNVQLTNAATWTCNIRDSSNITINNVIINNNVHVANTDGIDLVGCRNAIVENCFIATGDDGICIKANSIQDADNIIIRYCEIMSLANCFKIGTETYKNVSNVYVHDCLFFRVDIMGGYAGIAIESVDGSNLSDILIEDIRMDGVLAPLLIWLGNRNGEGSIDGIIVRNIEANRVDLPSAITGMRLKEGSLSIKNVTLENFLVSYREANETITFAPSNYYESSMTGYPEITRVFHRYVISHELSDYWDIPVYGLFVRHVDGLTVKNFKVRPRIVNNRPLDNIRDENGHINLINLYIEDLS